MSKDYLKTENGYPLKMVRSTLQKCVRYGDEVHAGFWAAEMHESGYTNYLFTTIACIAVEDIGNACPATLSAIMSTCNFYKELYKEKKGKAEYTPGIGICIAMMCRARKSRVGDNFYQYVSEKRKNGWKPPIPEFAYDEHTAMGRDKGRWWRFWVRVGAVLSNKATYEEIGGRDYEEEMSEYWLGGHPDHQDEPDYMPIDTSNPYLPIVEIPWRGELQKNSELRQVDVEPVPEEPVLSDAEIKEYKHEKK